MSWESFWQIVELVVKIAGILLATILVIYWTFVPFWIRDIARNTEAMTKLQRETNHLLREVIPPEARVIHESEATRNPFAPD